MGIRPHFRISDIGKALQSDLNAIEWDIFRIMKRCGEEFVNEAREAINISSSMFPKGNYKDDTDALRSSIGFFILKDNKVIHGDGNSSARAVLSKMESKSGYRLIGMAGMDYASYVESKGYNVISSQQYVCFINLNVRLQTLAKKLKAQGLDFDTN